MSYSFLQLMAEAFPNISSETVVKLHGLIRQKHVYKTWLFNETKIDHLCQGDVISAIPIIYVADNGYGKRELPALILNNTCDLQMDDGNPRCEFVTVVPLFPFKDYIQAFRSIPNHERDIKENVITHKFYLSGIPNYAEDYIADFSLVSSIESKRLHEELKQGKIKRVCSFSFNGYFYLLAKLTLHFMRRESTDVRRDRLQEEGVLETHSIHAKS